MTTSTSKNEGRTEDLKTESKIKEERPDFKTVRPAASSSRAQSSAVALDFSVVQGKLYDRQEEKALLFRSLDRLLNGKKDSSRELVLVTGFSGTGKTELAYTLRQPVQDQHGGLFLAGKFDQLRSPKPFAAFLQAFTHYVDIVVGQGEDAVKRARTEIQNALRTECELLTNMIPSLEQIIGKKTGAAPVPQGPEAQKRFKYVFRLFMRSICLAQGRDRPVVLVLDDLQYADTGSLKLLHALATDPENQQNLMLVGTCRHNEVSVRDELAAVLRAIEDGGIGIKNIQVTNLSEKAVSDMISDLLQMPKDETESLVELVWSHTKGNVVFIMYFLRSLVEQGVLQQEDSTSSRWTWNGSEVEDHDFADDVVSLVAATMCHLDDSVQEELKIAACLGAEFTKKTLQHALSDPSASSVDSFLTTTMELGLMLYDFRSEKVRFVHDRVQQAAYSLIPEEGRASFHFDLGMTLWKSVPADDVDEWMFAITSQLSRGIHLVEDQKEKYRLAALFLRAGEKAVLSSAFATAATYTGQGIELLNGKRCWRDEYDLSLALYDAGAEIAYCVGDFEMVDHCIEQVLQNADKSFRDKLRAVSTQVYALGARDRLDEAIDVALDVLRLLSEPFPRSVGNATLAIETIRTKWVLRDKSDRRILRLPRMTDPDKSASMKMLNLAFLHAYQARPEYAPLIALRQVRLTMKYGLSPISACGFATYGMILCVMGDASQGYRYGQLALKIHEQFGATEYVPRIYAGVFGCIHHWSKPLRGGLDYVEKASKMGFLTGDIEYGTLEANVYCVNALDAGCPLVEVENKLRHNCTVMSSYNQDTELGFARILLQGVLNLRGQAPDPLELTGEVLEESEAIKEMASKGNVTFLCFIYIMKLWVAYILGDYEQAESMAILSRNVDRVVFCAFDSCVQCFFDGMTALSLAQEGRREGDIRVARSCLKRMTNWAKNCPTNCLHKRYLLEAEFAVLRGRHALAIEKFTSGIVLAKEQQFLHEQAIGHERLGRYLLRCGEKATGESELHKAVGVYETWGAKGKVAAMKKEFPSCLTV